MTRNFGRYEVQTKIGIGGMGEVYLGRAVGVAGFEKTVVIKRILPHLTNDAEMVSSLVNEAKLLVNLNHPNIVQVIDLGAEGTDYFMVMEYVHGYDLGALIRHCSVHKIEIPVAVTIRIVSDVLQGLTYAHAGIGSRRHRCPVIHRDISPQNVLIDYTGQVKLTDFGIAKTLRKPGDENTSTIRGKYRYLAPELLDTNTFDQRTDIFAVGIVLFEVLTRRHLYDADADVQVITQAQNAEVPPIQDLDPRVSDDLAAVVHRALARSPSDRYPSAREMNDALDAVEGALPENAARDEVRAFVGRIFDAEGFPPERKKLPSQAETDQLAVTRSLNLMLHVSALERGPLEPIGARVAATEPPGRQVERRRGQESVGRSRRWMWIAAVPLLLLGAGAAYWGFDRLDADRAEPSPQQLIVFKKAQSSPPDPSTPPTTPAADAAPEPAGPGQKKPRKPRKATPPEVLDPKVGARIMGRHLGSFNRCFARHPPAATSGDQMIVVSRLVSSGRVAQVSLEPAALQGTPLGRCVVRIAGRIRYPRHRRDGLVFKQVFRLDHDR
jgi:serine/threonine-protein kinase